MKMLGNVYINAFKLLNINKIDLGIYSQQKRNRFELRQQISDEKSLSQKEPMTIKILNSAEDIITLSALPTMPLL